jgi:purine-nucleoside phosphorylase
VAVSDHVNLTWRSPLTGPNDASVGPRFPSMTGIYRPEVVLDRVGAAGGIIVDAGVVAGVRDDGRLTSYEEEVARVPDYLAVSEELVPVVIVAAHMGLRVAAAVVLEGS